MALPRRSALLLLLLLLLIVLLVGSAVVESGGGGEELGWAGARRRRSCDGAVGECGVDEDDEDGMFDASSARQRVLAATTGYISYDALRSDSVPCSLRGASYYNCQPGADANPYSRGCSAITLCRSAG